MPKLTREEIKARIAEAARVYVETFLPDEAPPEDRALVSESFICGALWLLGRITPNDTVPITIEFEEEPS
jgi:hypothetical protein